MNYLRNAWYAAAWSEEIGRTPLSRKFLDQPITLFRATSGIPVALADRCPHRFAPLSKGKLVEDAIECPYHGLRFDTDGRCVYNYHGPVPKAASVHRYPMMERYGVAWIWMGEPDAAREKSLPDFGIFGGDERFAIVRGYLSVTGNYQLVIDNLLDLSHGQFLHPAFANANSGEHMRFHMKVDGSTVWANYEFNGEPVVPFVRPFWESPSQTCDRWADMRWEAPSNLHLDVGVTECGHPREEGLLLPSAHFLTPETSETTHYFWMNARNHRIDDEALDKLVWQATDDAFRNQDEPIISLCQNRMAGKDFEELNPILLSTDRAAARARRMLARLISAEQASQQLDGNTKT